ncbi:cbb3-type cytochrome c oxidase subunit I [bacterium]|nr:cbb3-type cytochrome c oxidase subunit I [bacterium]
MSSTGQTVKSILTSPVHPEVNYLNATKGFASWFFTLDHKRIGIMYMCSILTAFFLGGVFAMLIRTELFTPGQLMFTSDQYNRVFTLHGAIMVFLVLIPGIPAALGNFVLPLMLGAKDVAFPRLNLLSYHLYVIGLVMALLVLGLGGIDTGWTFYTPYSIQTQTPVVLITSAAFILGFSSIFTGLNFIVTIHKMRPPSMTWFKMPLMLWALYSTALIQIVATPVLGITLLLLIVERVMHIGIFNPALGGDPVLFQHFFWFYSHPAVYIMILPAMGVISELVSTFSRKHIFGYRFIAYSSIAIAIFSFIVWGHHMFTSGQSNLMNMVFSALTFSVSIPSAVKMFNWLTTMYKGSINLATPMIYTLSFMFIFAIAGLTGLPLATLATDIHLHDTYFVVAHFHYTMMGSTLFAFVAGIHYWWPKMTGRMYNQKVARFAAWLVSIGFNVTFFSQFPLGSLGMPRRYHLYEAMPDWQIYHQISTIGAYMQMIGFLLAAYALISSLSKGKLAPRNPWGGATLEWETSTPPITFNFEETPDAGDPYDVESWQWSDEEGGYVKVRPSVVDEDHAE